MSVKLHGSDVDDSIDDAFHHKRKHYSGMWHRVGSATFQKILWYFGGLYTQPTTFYFSPLVLQHLSGHHDFWLHPDCFLVLGE